jgi:hypothetical protein
LFCNSVAKILKSEQFAKGNKIIDYRVERRDGECSNEESVGRESGGDFQRAKTKVQSSKFKEQCSKTIVQRPKCAGLIFHE